MKEKEIFDQCLNQLRSLKPVLKISFSEQKIKIDNRRFDAKIKVETETGKQEFLIEIKRVLKRPLPVHLLFNKDYNKKPYLLMCEYVNNSIAHDLKKHNINYIDTAGNVYLYATDVLYIERDGRKIVLTDSSTREPAIFQPKGLQLIFILLKNPELLDSTVRELADLSAISKDRVSTVLRDLKAEGYIQEVGKRKNRFVNKKIIFEQWLANYSYRLRPKLVLGTFKIAPSVMKNLPENLSNNLIKKPQGFAVGGSLGADLLIHYYRGTATELFIKPELFEKVKIMLKLIPAKKTNVTLLNLFSPEIIYKKNTPAPITHPLLIYAELLYQGGSRALETAGMIYNRYLKQDFDEN
ncbi:hypothetical protein J7K93_09955 [bacterium]|nr:hypothetical protein [bacterium]